MKTLISFLVNISLLLILNSACSETPNSPVKSPDTPSNGAAGAPGSEQKFELMSLTYEGSDLYGKACHIYISVAESDHEAEEHNHEFFAKVDYKLHGEGILDSTVVFKNYDLKNGIYSDADSADPSSLPALASAILKDQNTEVDFNKLLQYETSGELIQSVRIDFSNMNHNEFTTALEEVIEDDSLLETNRSKLNKINRAIIKISHNGHYDSVACVNFKLTEVKSAEYVINGDHDEHGDHDDDEYGGHDDEHGHKHGNH